MALSLVIAVCGLSLIAQTPPTNAAQQVHANLNQLMRGVLYPAANVVFSAQADNPGRREVHPRPRPLDVDRPSHEHIRGLAGGRERGAGARRVRQPVVIPGRSCSNGAPVPTKDPAWAMFVQEVRDVSMKAYKAAQAKDQDKMIEISETLSTACAGCHRKWRDRKAPDNRCK